MSPSHSSGSNSPPPVRTVRTYGRARQTEPDNDVDTSMLTGDVSARPQPSPRKAFVDRLTTVHAKWRDSLSTLDTEVTDEEAKAALKNLKAGKSKVATYSSQTAESSSRHSTSPLLSTPPPARPNERVREPTKQLLGQTSSLSELPTSSPPQGPTTVASKSPIERGTELPWSEVEVDNIETAPVVKSGLRGSGRPRRVVDSDNEDVDALGEGPEDEMEASDGDSDTPRPRYSRIAPVSPAPDRLPDVLDNMSQLFSDGEGSPTKSAGRKVKPLSKKEQDQLHRDIARAQREQRVALSRPQAEYKPISTWVENAQQAARELPTPVPLSDEIQQFTPSSASNAIRRKEVSRPRTSHVPAPSSPTPQGSKIPLGPSGSGTLDFAEEEDFDLDLEGAITQEMERSNMSSRLAEAKRAALKMHSERKTKAEEADSDDDFIIDDPPPKRPTALPITQQAASRDPRTALNNRVVAGGSPSKQRQKVLMLSGKAALKHSPGLPTETHLGFAARDFGHAHLKAANGGSRPAGQKKGRDTAITHQQLEREMQARHQKQARMVARSREQQYGKGRSLPPKQTMVLDTSQIEAQGHEHADDVSDEEDEDFEPEYSGDEGEEEQLQYSGDEEGDGEEGGDLEEPAEGNGVATSPKGVPAELPEDGKENRPPSDLEDDEDLSVSLRRPKANRRVAFESDDEDAGAKGFKLPIAPASQRLSEVKSQSKVVGSPTQLATAESSHAEAFFMEAEPELDFGGFDASGGGFSQLFATTQAGGEAEDTDGDGFAGLRNDNAEGLLPSHAALPSAKVSESQARRDNALIAGEMEDIEQDDRPARKARQYLNSQGFFTQTRPSGRADSDTDEEPVLEPTAIPELSSTLIATDTSGPEPFSSPSKDMPTANSPTQSGRQLQRLRHRSSPEAVQERSNDAFDLLRAGARQAAQREFKANRVKPSALIDEQAEESDEDTGWGFPTGNDGDEDEDDDTGYVPDLLDDTKMTEEEEKRQEELVASKYRQIEQEDDAKREAQAKKVTEGEYRTKRRGNDFLSDDEGDEDGTKKRRLSKKQRKQRKLEMESGIATLEGEVNVFQQAYDEDMESDNDFEEAPPSPGVLVSPGPRMSRRQQEELLRERARQNRDVGDYEVVEQLWAQEIEVSESQFSIRRTTRTITALVSEDHSGRPQRQLGSTRTLENYASIVRDEAVNPRRVGAGGAGGTSVVSRQGQSGQSGLSRSGSSTSSSKRDAGRGVRRHGSSILMTKNSAFEAD